MFKQKIGCKTPVMELKEKSVRLLLFFGTSFHYRRLQRSFGDTNRYRGYDQSNHLYIHGVDASSNWNKMKNAVGQEITKRTGVTI